MSTAAAQRKRGWRTWRFDQMAVMVNDRIDTPSEAGVDRYVGLEHLDSDSLTIRRWGSPSDVEATKLRFRAGDIIFGRRRVYQRKLGVPDFDGICSAHAMVLRAKPEVALPEFLPFFMQSDLFMERAKQISVGSLSPTINWKTLAKEEFALPPLEEQRQIAEVLRALETAIDNSVTCSASIEAVLLSAAADLLHIRGLCLVGNHASTPLPAGWRWAEGREVFAAMSGNGEPVVDEHGDALFLKVADFNRNDEELALTAAESRFHVRENPRVRLFAPGTVVFPKRGATIFLNKAGVLGVPAALDPNLMGLVPEVRMIRPEFLYWVVKSIGLWHFADTTSLPQLNHKHLNPLRLPLPPMEEQGGIVAQLRLLRSASGTFCVRRSALRSMKSELIGHELGLEAQ